jgi:hypothetical protein
MTVEDDWMHSNAIDYNPNLDQIVLSVRSFDEIWIIDHSTTDGRGARRAQGGRSGMGGRLLYRYGNPAAYQAQARRRISKLFKQHDSHWIPRGLPGRRQHPALQQRQRSPRARNASSVG